MIDADSTLADVCFAVWAALDARGMSAVLTGGSAAAMYAPNAYMSYDADFVLEPDDSLDRVAPALGTIGFARASRSRIFTHDATDYTIDFPKGPLAVGGDYITETDLLEKAGSRVRIIRRIDCIRDRLAHFYHWSDFTALGAAVGVAATIPGQIDFAYLRDWTARESTDLLLKFAEFEKRLDDELAQRR